jgi:hypothetical protein
MMLSVDLLKTPPTQKTPLLKPLATLEIQVLKFVETPLETMLELPMESTMEQMSH